MDAELRRGEHRVAVGAEAVERDVAEIEEPRVPDRDVEAERKQHVQQRVEADADVVAVARHHRNERRDDPEAEVERGRRDALELALDDAEDPRAARPPLLVRGDPLVDADARRVRIGRLGHTFCTAARPSRPLGRAIMTAMRITNTIASENVDER